MGQAVKVRPLEARDAARWRELFDGYLAFYKTSVAEDVIGLTWQRLLSGAQIGLVAVDANDRPIGLAHVLFHASTWSPTCYCYLEDLFVDPARRQKGVGRALIEAVYARADAHGCSRTYWMTQETNATARQLYERIAVRSGFLQYRHIVE